MTCYLPVPPHTVGEIKAQAAVIWVQDHGQRLVGHQSSKVASSGSGNLWDSREHKEVHLDIKAVWQSRTDDVCLVGFI